MLDVSDLPLDTVEGCEESLKRIVLAVASKRMSDAQGRTLCSLVKLKLECSDLRKVQQQLDDMES